MTGADLSPQPHDDPPVDFLEGLRAVVADGPRSRQMLLTMLADYWLEPGARAPSGALVDLAAEFGISQSGARTMLTRLARDERVTVLKEGRRTLYQLTPWMRRRLGTGLERMRTFGRHRTGADRPPRWLCVAFSIPEDQRAVRHKLRTGLQWLGFAPWYDGLWISPEPETAAVQALLSRLEVGSASVFEADLKAAGQAYGAPTDAWDLTAIRSLYDDFLLACEPVLVRLRSGRFSEAEALVWRTQLVNVWRLVPTLDPGLPLALLPSDWPRERARASFEELYGGLAAPALARIRTAVRRHAPDYASLAEAHDLGLGATL
ncbi:MAG: PaaX family transcriptional regulator C-terminal domain-containing protein [Nocardioides sp.]|uniref:PaaX family transcriptional regulator n=1 Tax=Nocardioides sp. TaxID=35761 RepID=UPI0039E6266E